METSMNELGGARSRQRRASVLEYGGSTPFSGRDEMRLRCNSEAKRVLSFACMASIQPQVSDEVGLWSDLVRGDADLLHDDGS